MAWQRGSAGRRRRAVAAARGRYPPSTGRRSCPAHCRTAARHPLHTSAPQKRGGFWACRCGFVGGGVANDTPGARRLALAELTSRPVGNGGAGPVGHRRSAKTPARHCTRCVRPMRPRRRPPPGAGEPRTTAPRRPSCGSAAPFPARPCGARRAGARRARSGYQAWYPHARAPACTPPLLETRGAGRDFRGAAFPATQLKVHTSSLRPRTSPDEDGTGRGWRHRNCSIWARPG